MTSHEPQYTRYLFHPFSKKGSVDESVSVGDCRRVFKKIVCDVLSASGRVGELVVGEKLLSLSYRVGQLYVGELS